MGTYTQLSEALADRYPDRGDGRRILSLAGVAHRNVNLDGPPITMWFAILDYVQRRGRTAHLLHAVVWEHPALEEVSRRFQADQAVSAGSCVTGRPLDWPIDSTGEADEGVRGPPLSPAFGSGRSRLTFYGYEVDFFGRVGELEELRAFASKRFKATPDFAWWLWSGSGGQGKTRLAAEFCAELTAAGWRCGFFPRAAGYDGWSAWTVSVPTFIVMDHVASRAEEVGNAIAFLSRNAERHRAPLRVLLIERPFDTSDPWVDRLVPSISPHEAADVLAFAYRPDGRACRSLADCTRRLTSLADQDLLAIVGNVFTQSDDAPGPSLPASAVVDWLRDVDPETRPLFLILATSAISGGVGNDLRRWNRQDVVEAVLRRDFLLWKDALGVLNAERLGGTRRLFEDHLTLVIAATITTRTDPALLEQLRDFRLSVPERIQSDWMRVITGDPSAGNERDMPSLKPDIVGECFVLERCSGGFGVDASSDFVRGQTIELLSACLATAPGQTIEFIGRCISDFPLHDGLLSFAAMTIPEGKDANVGHLMDYVVHFGQVAAMLSRADREDIAESCWSKMIAVAGEVGSVHNADFAGMIDGYLATAYYNRGVSRLRGRKLREAAADAGMSTHYAEESIGARSVGIERSRMERVRLGSLRLRAVIDLDNGDLIGARRTLDDILLDANAASAERAEAFLVRAAVRRRGDDLDGAIADLGSIWEMGDESRLQQEAARFDLAEFLLARSIRASDAGRLDPALADLDRALRLAGGEMPVSAAIRVNRSVLRMKIGLFELAEQDCTAVLESPDAPADQTFKALLNRGQLKSLRCDWQGADADLHRALEATVAGGHDRAHVLLARAPTRWSRGDRFGACEDVRAARTAGGTDEPILAMAAMLLKRYGCSR